MSSVNGVPFSKPVDDPDTWWFNTVQNIVAPFHVRGKITPTLQKRLRDAGFTVSFVTSGGYEDDEIVYHETIIEPPKKPAVEAKINVV